jgi:hypothetical protein
MNVSEAARLFECEQTASGSCQTSWRKSLENPPMATNGTAKLTIDEASRMSGNVLIHFSNGTSVYYHADFLWSIRENECNVAIPDEAASEDNDLLGLPD